jgi:two-component sensor histidine kinase
MLLSGQNISPENYERVSNVLEVIMSYARLDFTRKTDVTGKGDAIDALCAGVNMLGEELESSTLSLREKEQLLKEIHHRVKNNLQIVSSLLNLQSENIKDAGFQNMVIASRNRINSMALVHEMLYASSDLTKIEIGEYIKRLSQNIYISLSKPNAAIYFTYNIEKSYYFEIDKMIPLGLIINEVITNSMKYAFPENKGVITISISDSGERTELLISDNGVGFPEGFSFEKNSNLGLQLIKMLTEQLGGNLNINFKAGTSYSITF